MIPSCLSLILVSFFSLSSHSFMVCNIRLIALLYQQSCISYLPLFIGISTLFIHSFMIFSFSIIFLIRSQIIPGHHRNFFRFYCVKIFHFFTALITSDCYLFSYYIVGNIIFSAFSHSTAFHSTFSIFV